MTTRPHWFGRDPTAAFGLRALAPSARDWPTGAGAAYASGAAVAVFPRDGTPVLAELVGSTPTLPVFVVVRWPKGGDGPVVCWTADPIPENQIRRWWKLPEPSA